MQLFIGLLSLFAISQNVCALQIGFSGTYFTESVQKRASNWRRVLPFSAAGPEQSRFDQSTRRISWFSAIPNEALNATLSKSSSVDTSALLKQEAEELRRRAKELMAEVRKMEAELKATKTSSKKKREQETEELIERMFLNRPLTPEAAAQVIKEEKWTADEAQMVLDGLFSKAYETTSITKKDGSTDEPKLDKKAVTTTSTTTTAQNNSSQTAAAAAPVQTFNATEALLLEAKMDCLINAAEIVDEITLASKDSVRRWSGRVGSLLRARRNELRRAHEQNLARQLVLYEGATPVNGSSSISSTSTVGLMEEQGQWPSRTALKVNVSEVIEQVAMVPLWVPSTLLQFLASSTQSIESSDVKTIKEKVLSGTAFFCTSVESIGKAAIFRGNVRGVMSTDRNVTAGIVTEIQQRLKAEGLSDRLQIFFLTDPEWKQSRDQTQPQAPPKPVVLAIPADVVPDPKRVPKKESITAKALKVTAAAIPIVSTFMYSISCYALNPKFFDAVMRTRDIAVLSACLPVFIGVFAVQAIHELAHYVVARKRGIKIGRPFPLPSFQIGTFGCITPLRSFPENRSALLDFALSGPVSAMMISIAMMIAGIRLTVRASGADILGFPVLPVALLKSSFLTGSLLTLFAPKAMVLPLSQPFPLHPMFVIGYAGLLSSALNLLPIFRLDGGRACSAAMGSRFGAVASSGTLLFMFSVALSSRSGVAATWGALILLFQRRFEIPLRDEVTEVDDVRMGGWIGSLATAILALLPFPGGPNFL